MTVPGLIRRSVGYAIDPDSPLFILWCQMPFIAPWLIRYLSYANNADTRRIAAGLTTIVCDSVEQHRKLAEGTAAAHWLNETDCIYAYPNRATYMREEYAWSLRREPGWVPREIEGI